MLGILWSGAGVLQLFRLPRRGRCDSRAELRSPWKAKAVEIWEGTGTAFLSPVPARPARPISSMLLLLEVTWVRVE